jgi:hypothetical protein
VDALIVHREVRIEEVGGIARRKGVGQGMVHARLPWKRLRLPADAGSAMTDRLIESPESDNMHFDGNIIR